MTTQSLNKVNQTLGFFSMTIAGTLMNLLHSIYLVWTNGKADDGGVIIFRSGFFMMLSWAIFIIFPLNQLDHSRQIFKPLIFPFIAGLYGTLTYSIIVGGLFRSFDLVVMFLPLALLTGFIFGISYSQFIRSDKLINYLVRRPLAKTTFILSPVISIFFFLWVCRQLHPHWYFAICLTKLDIKLFLGQFPNIKLGATLRPPKNSLPGNLDHIDNGSGNMSATMENFSFVLQVNCNKIIRLEYGTDQNNFDGTIYGKLHEKPRL